jgi:hypothetical protein
MSKPISVGINIVAIDEATKPVKQVVEMVKQVGAALDHFKAQSKVIGDRINGVNQEINLPVPYRGGGRDGNDGGFKKPPFDFPGPPNTVGSEISALISAGKSLFLAFGAGGSFYLANRFSKELSKNFVDMALTSKRLALPTAEIRKYSYAANVAGISTENFQQSMKDLSAAQFDSKRGIPSDRVKGIEASFLELDPKLSKDWNKKPVTDLTVDITKALSKIKSPELKTRLTTQIFGNEEMLKVDLLGAEKFQKMASQFKVDPLPESALQKAYAFNQVSAKIRQQFEDLKYGVGTDLMQAFSEVLETLNKISEKTKPLTGKASSLVGHLALSGSGAINDTAKAFYDVFVKLPEALMGKLIGKDAKPSQESDDYPQNSPFTKEELRRLSSLPAAKPFMLNQVITQQKAQDPQKQTTLRQSESGQAPASKNEPSLIIIRHENAPPGTKVLLTKGSQRIKVERGLSFAGGAQ